MTLRLTFFAILAFFLRTAYSANETECGKLNVDYFNNVKNITELDEFPWMAQVGYKVSGEIKYQCSAVLINQRYLISAAHCHGKFNADHVLLGEWNPTNKADEKDCNSEGKCAPLPQKYEISTVAVHPDYDAKNHDNDLALLRLKDLVTFTEYISPICMPMSEYDNVHYSGQYLPTTGFTLPRDPAAYKVKALVHVMGLSSCNEALEKFNIVVKGHHICGISDAKKVIQSGSPLMGIHTENGDPQRFYLLGIVSAGSTIPGTPIPDIFVRIPSYRDWINSNIVE